MLVNVKVVTDTFAESVTVQVFAELTQRKL